MRPIEILLLSSFLISNKGEASSILINKTIVVLVKSLFQTAIHNKVIKLHTARSQNNKFNIGSKQIRSIL
jgi:ribosomal protein S17